MLLKWCEVSPFLISIVVLFQMKVTEYVLDENDQLMPMNRLHGENTVSDVYHQHAGKNACGLYSLCSTIGNINTTFMTQIGMIAWRLQCITPECPEGREVSNLTYLLTSP